MTTEAPPDPIMVVRDQLRLREDQLLALLGPTIPLERFLTVALHAVNGNKEILQCTPLSIVEAIREAASLGLEPSGLLGDAYLVRYGDQAKLMPGYRGLMKLARRHPDISAIGAQVVYQGDDFEISQGSEPAIWHVPLIGGDRGTYLGAYAYARLAGELVPEWMSVDDIEQVRRSSKAGQRGPWVAFWGEMARKSVLRRLMKHLPLDTIAEDALRLEAEAEQDAHSSRRPPDSLRRIHKQLGIDTGPSGQEPAPPSAAGGTGVPEPVGVPPADAPTPTGLAFPDDDLPPMP